MLSFIKECIFSPDWHSSIFKEACHQLNEERVSAHIYIYIRKRASRDSIDIYERESITRFIELGWSWAALFIKTVGKRA